MNIILIYFAIKYKGDWDKIYNALEEKEKVSLEDMNKLEKRLKDSKWSIGTILDADYPEKLKEAYKPPFVFWYKGDKSILNKDHVCVTGDIINQSIIDNVNKNIKDIPTSYSLVTHSGIGVDKNILDSTEEKSRLFILSDGLDNMGVVTKPTEKDLVFSEYPPESPTTWAQGKNSLRIVAAFGDSLILFGSNEDAGGDAKNLVTQFQNLNKPVYVFPGNTGNDKLIKDGCVAINSIKDAFE